MIKKRETEKILEIEERTFKIKKLDPLLGNYILMTLLTMTLPFGLTDEISKQTGKDLNKTNPTLDKLSFLDFQRDVLSVCFEKLQGGDAPVIDADGGYGIQNPTSSLFFQLIVASLVFNFADFFGEIPSIFQSIKPATGEGTPQQ